jgi:zinc/manganese transport system permease protein
MLTDLQFILVPLVASILLLAITSYFGIHVLKREIIFIDIALAQIAALGGVVVVYLEEAFELHGTMIGNRALTGILETSFSLLFCLVAALIFAFLRNPRIRVPIEAFIGIAYAFATTAAVIILDKGAGSDVHLHDMLTGVLLWTTWPQVLRLAVVLAVIGGFHALFRKNFIRLSARDPVPSEKLSRQKLWDFLFYFTFGIVIIEAVKIAGVLTVFAFLILPASISALFSSGWRSRILIGTGTGILATIGGLYLSITLDLTASPLIILFLGVILLISLFVRMCLKRGTVHNNLKYP